jgi:hypothetical protein
MRYHTGISEDQPGACDNNYSDSGDEEDDFDWEFNDCEFGEDKVCADCMAVYAINYEELN